MASHLTSLFLPLPLDGLWSNSAVSSLGEPCTFTARSAPGMRVLPIVCPWIMYFFSEQLFTPHHCHFLRLDLFS